MKGLSVKGCADEPKFRTAFLPRCHCLYLLRGHESPKFMNDSYNLFSDTGMSLGDGSVRSLLSEFSFFLRYWHCCSMRSVDVISICQSLETTQLSRAKRLPRRGTFDHDVQTEFNLLLSQTGIRMTEQKIHVWLFEKDRKKPQSPV